MRSLSGKSSVLFCKRRWLNSYSAPTSPLSPGAGAEHSLQQEAKEEVVAEVVEEAEAEGEEELAEGEEVAVAGPVPGR
jgi:hypothetical protein